jgi:alpha-galactosidase/6-phospho-beta-glucosidase family protein
MSQDLDLTQSMSFFSITGTSGSKEQQLKLPSLPKNEGQFTLWRIKVESTIHGAGLMDYITHEKTKLYSRALDRLNNYRREQNKDEEKVHLDELPEQQKEAVDNRRFKVYAALAETLTTAEQNRILLNVKDHPVGDAYIVDGYHRKI